MHRISTDRFTYHPADRAFTAEASELGGLRLGRVYPDACDVGFTLVSARTGRAVRVILAHTERDREGDTLWTDFAPAPEDRKAAGFDRVRVFND